MSGEAGSPFGKFSRTPMDLLLSYLLYVLSYIDKYVIQLFDFFSPDVIFFLFFFF